MHQITYHDILSVESIKKEHSSIYFTSILSGDAEGVIWADSKENPEFLMIWSEYQQDFQFMGNALPQENWSQFRKWFDITIIPFLISKKLNYFEYGIDDQEFAIMMNAIFWDKKIEHENQKFYTLTDQLNKLVAPEGYECVSVNREFLEKDYQNMSFIIDELKAAFGSVDTYLAKGCGYAAIYNQEVVARSIMTMQQNGECNVSVHTVETHRRKGLSAYLSSKTIEKIQRNQQTPVWDCCDTNIASQKTAVKCGFNLVREDPIYWFTLDIKGLTSE